MDLQKYYDPIIVEKTNAEIDKKMKFEKMLHALDEKKKDLEFDTSKFPKYNFTENKYELFATIDQTSDGRFVAYVLKEKGTQWYIIDEDKFKPCEASELDEVT